MSPLFSQESDWANVHFHIEIFTASDFTGELTPLKQSCGLALNTTNRVLLVKGRSGLWQLPGGRIEPDETPVEALNRELLEEAAVIVDQSSIQLAFFQSNSITKDGITTFKGYELRYFCKIIEQQEFFNDPDKGDVTEQMYCEINELDKYLLWGETTTFIQQLLKNFIISN